MRCGNIVGQVDFAPHDEVRYLADFVCGQIVQHRFGRRTSSGNHAIRMKPATGLGGLRHRGTQAHGKAVSAILICHISMYEKNLQCGRQAPE